MPHPLRALLIMGLTLCLAVPAAAQDPSADPASTPWPRQATQDQSAAPDDGAGSPSASPSFAQFAGEPPPTGNPVWPGVWRDARRTALADRKGVDVQILHVEPGADVEVLPTLAGGSVRGLATVADQSGDPFAGGVAGINGGFWLSSPFGEPNGLVIRDGRMISDAESQGVGPRGAVGWTRGGQVLIDRMDSTETITLPDGAVAVLSGVNRNHRDVGEQHFDGQASLLAYTTDFGGPVVLREPVRPPAEEPSEEPSTAPPPIPDPDPSATPEPTPPPEPIDLAAIRLAIPTWPASGPASGEVTGITRDSEATFTVTPGEVIVLARGEIAGAFDQVDIGDRLEVGTVLRPQDPAREAMWADVDQAIAAGPHIVSRGAMTDPAGWQQEGFDPVSHSGQRAPRSAIGVTADGRLLMVTADGRRPGITAGFTMAELADYMLALGAVDALSLDGGGSSQLVHDGLLRNAPCCDSSTRRVATSIQVRHDYAFSGAIRLAGDGRIDTANAVAAATHPQGSARAVLASSGSFADALAGGPLASALGGPLLLSNSTRLTSSTAATLASLGVRDVWVLGGEAALEAQVADDLRARGIGVIRLQGETRVETAAAIAAEVRRVRGDTGRAFVVPAGTFPDALLAAAPAGMLGMPIVLTTNGSLHPAAEAAVAGAAEVILLDADGQLSAAVPQRLGAIGITTSQLGGGGRYATSAAVATWLAQQVPLGDEVVVAMGETFPDALAGGPLAAARRVPLMLVPGPTIDGHPDAGAWFSRAAGDGRLARATILGGAAAVSTYAQWQLEGFSR